MRGIRFIVVPVFTAVLVSCSVKEDRGDCPSHVSITVERDGGRFDGGKGSINLYKNGTIIGSDVLTGMDKADTTLSYMVQPRGEVSAIVSNHPVFADRIVADNNTMFPKLFISRTDLQCIHDEESFHVSGYGKEHIILHLQLDETAKETDKTIYFTVEGRYDGINVVSMQPSEGGFRYASVFDRDGRGTVVIPRQAGPGLTLILEKLGIFRTEYDIYRAMLSAGYNFNGTDLDDFDVRISLNSITGRIRVPDWNSYDIDNTEF